MDVVTNITEVKPEQVEDRSGIAGHPKGLTTLFLTEVWERFSYYGMRALLVLYMAAPVVDGGLEFETSKATTTYGIYTGAVYLMSLPGGWLADRFLGARLTVLLGGIIIAAGHFLLAFASMPTFYGGLALIVLGTGLLKPNISTMVGGLYGENDPRRDSGFSIFYMGINIGAMMGPLVAGYLGQRINWHLGFAAAGVGMVIGIIQYLFHIKRLSQVGARPERIRSEKAKAPKQPLTKEEKRRLAIIAILFFFSILFWTSFEQAGSSFNLFAQRHTRDAAFRLRLSFELAAIGELRIHTRARAGLLLALGQVGRASALKPRQVLYRTALSRNRDGGHSRCRPADRLGKDQPLVAHRSLFHTHGGRALLKPRGA